MNHDCLVNPIWLGEHEYNARSKTCTSLAECRKCGKQRRSFPYQCLGNGDGEECERKVKEASKVF